MDNIDDFCDLNTNDKLIINLNHTGNLHSFFMRTKRLLQQLIRCRFTLSLKERKKRIGKSKRDIATQYMQKDKTGQQRQ